MVIYDGVEVRTVNLCQQCHNEGLTAQGLAPLTNWQLKAVVEKKAYRGRLLSENAGERPVHTRNVGVFLSCVRAKAKKFQKDAVKEKQEGIQGQWRQESPAREFLEQVNSNADTDYTPKMMRCGYHAWTDGDWEEYNIIFKVEVSAAEWAFGRIREAFEKVTKDEARSLNMYKELC